MKTRTAGFLFTVLTLAFASQVNAGEIFRVNTTTESRQRGWAVSQRHVSMNSSGNSIVVFGGDGGADDWEVYAQRYNARREPVGGETILNQTHTDAQYLPCVALHDDGHFVAAWIGNVPGDSGGIAYRIFNENAEGLTSDTLANTPVATGQENPCIAMDASGRFMITWSTKEPDGTRDVYGRFFQADGTPEGDQFMINTSVPGHQRWIECAMDAAGNAFVVWGGNGPLDFWGHGVYGQRYDSTGNPVGGNFLIPTQYAASEDNPSVSMNASGQAAVAWTGDGPGTQDVYLCLYDSSGTAVGPDIRVTDNKVDDLEPNVAVAEDGSVLVTWVQNGIRGRWYDAQGNPITPTFLVEDNSNGGKEVPSADFGPGGDFLIIYNSFGADGSDWGVYGRFMADAKNSPDTDRDGISDGFEFMMAYEIDGKDTDGDGFEDGVELALGYDPANPASPANATDADQDGVPDSDDPDTSTNDADGDKITDAYEIAHYSDPNDAEDTAPLGDANNDGNISYLDAFNVMNATLGNIGWEGLIEERYVDVNRDGIQNYLDGVLVIQLYLGTMTYLPFSPAN